MKLVNLTFALSVSVVMAMNVLAQDPNNACKPTDTLARYGLVLTLVAVTFGDL